MTAPAVAKYPGSEILSVGPDGLTVSVAEPEPVGAGTFWSEPV